MEVPKKSGCILKLIQDGDESWQNLWKEKILQLQNTSLADGERLNELLSCIHVAFIVESITLRLQAFMCWVYFLERYDELNLPVQVNFKMSIPLIVQNHTQHPIVDAKIKAWDTYMNSVVLTASSQTLNSAVPHMLKFLYDPTHYLPCASSYGDLIEKCARLYLKTMEKSMHESMRMNILLSFADSVFFTLMKLKDDCTLALDIWKQILSYICAKSCSNNDLVYLTETIEHIIFCSNLDEENLLVHLLKHLSNTHPDLLKKCANKSKNLTDKCTKYAFPLHLNIS